MNGFKNNFLSVIVPAYNAERTLAACLESLLDQSYEKSGYEVIVVDDGSTDGTGRTAERFKVRVKSQHNRGPASARNRGVREASGDIILFTDADCVADRDWIKEMVAPLLADSRVAAVKGAYKTKQKKLAARFAQAEFEDRYDLLGRHATIDMVDTYSAGFRKEVFLKMGGFDETFPVANNEDTDLSYRLAASGYKLVFNPRAFVYHTHPDTLYKYLRTKFWRGYWRMVVYRRYPDKAVKDSYTPAVIKIQTLLMALSIGFFFFSSFMPHLVYPAGLLWAVILVTSLPFSLKTYKKDKWVGIASPAFILCRAVAFALGSVLGAARCLLARRGDRS